MKVEEIMTKDVITVKMDRTVRDVVTLLHDHHMGGIPVVDNTGLLVGVISEYDIVRLINTKTSKLSLKFPSSHTLGLVFQESITNREVRDAFNDIADMKIFEVMIKDVPTMSPNADVSDVAAELRKDHIKRLPIIDDSGKVVGIVTRRDLLMALI